MRKSPGEIKSIKDASDALHKYHGNATNAAKSLGVCKDTLYRFIKENPELSDELKKARDNAHEYFIDKAENAIDKVLSRVDEQPKAALDAAKYVLDKRGKSRGWIVTVDESKYSDEQLDLLNAFMAQFSSLQSARKIDNSNNNAEHKS